MDSRVHERHIDRNPFVQPERCVNFVDLFTRAVCAWEEGGDVPFTAAWLENNGFGKILQEANQLFGNYRKAVEILPSDLRLSIGYTEQSTVPILQQRLRMASILFTSLPDQENLTSEWLIAHGYADIVQATRNEDGGLRSFAAAIGIEIVFTRFETLQESEVFKLVTNLAREWFKQAVNMSFYEFVQQKDLDLYRFLLEKSTTERFEAQLSPQLREALLAYQKKKTKLVELYYADAQTSHLGKASMVEATEFDDAMITAFECLALATILHQASASENNVVDWAQRNKLPASRQTPVLVARFPEQYAQVAAEVQRRIHMLFAELDRLPIGQYDRSEAMMKIIFPNLRDYSKLYTLYKDQSQRFQESTVFRARIAEITEAYQKWKLQEQRGAFNVATIEALGYTKAANFLNKRGISRVLPSLPVAIQQAYDKRETTRRTLATAIVEVREYIQQTKRTTDLSIENIQADLRRDKQSLWQWIYRESRKPGSEISFASVIRQALERE